MEIVLVLSHAIKAINENKYVLVSNLWLPVILIFIISFIDSALNPGVFTLVVSFIEILTYTIFAVTIHRIIIIGPSGVENNKLLSWSKRETTFALHLAFLIVIISIVSSLKYIPFFGGVFVFVGLIWILIRLSLAFPGIAVDKELSFNRSWELTAEFKMLMFLTVIVLPILLSLLTYIVSMLPFPEFFLVIYTILVIIFEVAALSSVYQLILGERYSHIE